MSEPNNGFEYLEKLREKNGRQIQNFLALTNYLDFKARDKGIPVHGQFELTPLCNFSCKMCYVHLKPEQMLGQPILPVDTWKNLMAQAIEAGMLQASLTGGECLTYPGFDELYLFLQDHGCNVAILTNGYLLNEKRIKFFREHMPARIQVTLYGWNDDVYERVTGQRAFTTVINNVKKAIEAGLPISLNITPSIYLGEDVFETVRLGMSFDRMLTINSSIFSPREETGRANQKDDPDTDLYVRIYKYIQELQGVENKEIDPEKLPAAGGPIDDCTKCGLRCSSGRSAFGMDWKGKMAACGRMDMICAEPLKIGFQAAWKQINEIASNWPRVQECINCPYDSKCDNCAANMLQYAKPGEKPTALCERTKYLIQKGVRRIPQCE